MARHNRGRFISILFVVALLLMPASVFARQGKHAHAPGDPATLAMMHEINEQLQSMGLNIAVAEIEYFNIGQGRPSNRILQQPFRWVPNDPNRLADGNNITYIVDQSGGNTASGLSNAETEAAIDRSMTTWDESRCFSKVDIIKRADSGSDVTIFDSFFGFGGFGDPFAADIVSAGWFPPEFFAAAGASPTGTLAFSVTFTFVDDNGNPLDANGDGYVDTALNEVYYNDAFGGTLRPENPWGINAALPSIDVETVALHENGHSLGIGHFGPPPTAVMNPVYGGILHAPLATDNAAMCTVWAQWPR